MNKREVGACHEESAALYLIKQDVKILERNFRNRFGEIDIVGLYKGTYLFVEVKYRKNGKVGEPIEAVTLSKQRTICKVSDYYRLCHGIGEEQACRFDVVAIKGEHLEWYQNAFSYYGG